MANRLGAGLGNGSAVPFFCSPNLQRWVWTGTASLFFINKDLEIETDDHHASVNPFYSYLLFHFVVIGVS